MKIAIQGYAGSFHHEAAQKFFGNEIEIIPCATFRELFKKVETGPDISAAVMAIENSIAGSILPNYSLLQQSHLKVVGEIYLLINHNLLALPEVTLKDIREVHSHPMALLQCTDYLDAHHWKLVETEDTALSARLINDNKRTHTAAIASALAAQLYHLQILEPNIQTEPFNYTRFLVLKKESPAIENPKANKASVFFEIKHQSGSLARILTLIAGCNINLSKLQSAPIPKTPWKYAFHVDMEFESMLDFNHAIEKLRDETNQLIIYGVYECGDRLI